MGFLDGERKDMGYCGAVMCLYSSVQIQCLTMKMLQQEVLIHTVQSEIR